MVLSIDEFRSAAKAELDRVRPLLIFDQFEELVTLFGGPVGARVQRELVQMIIGLLSTETLPVKVLLVFREDYLATILSLFSSVPELEQRFLRLQAPEPHIETLLEIIRGPFDRFPNLFSSPIPPDVAIEVAQAFAGRGAGTMSLSELQIVCEKLWRSEAPMEDIKEHGIQGLIEQYYTGLFEKLDEEMRYVAVALLARLVTASGTRNVVSQDDLVDRVTSEKGLDKESLLRALEALETEAHLILREARHNVIFYEIVSEYLVPWIVRRARAQETRIHNELRIHGIAGIAPRDVLYTDPVTTDPLDQSARVYRRRPKMDVTIDSGGRRHEFETRAFHWGSLTTGHWLTAFWILLGPFAFANVAGWMTTRPGKASHIAFRLAGLALTALFVVQLGFIFLVMPRALASETAAKPVVLVTTVAYLLFFVVGIVVRLSTQSHFWRFGWRTRFRLALWPLRRYLLPPLFWTDPGVADSEGQWEDPAGSRIDDGVLWREHAILHRIRRLHLAAGVLVITALIAVGLDLLWLRWVVIVFAALVLVTMVLTTTFPRALITQFLTAWAPLVSLAGFGLAYWQLIVSETVLDPWPGYHETTFAIALVLGVTGLTALLGGWVSLGAVVIGTLFGASLGAGAAYVANSYAGDDQLTENGAGWVVVAMLFLVLVIAMTALVLSFRDGGGLPGEGKVLALLRRITSRSRIIFVVAAVYGLAAVTAFALGCVGTFCSPEDLGIPQRGGVVYAVATVLMGALVVALSARLVALNRFLAGAVLLMGGVVVVLFARDNLPVIQIAGFTVDFNDLVDVAKVLIVILPASLVLRSMLGPFRRGTPNRDSGIIWDMASLWPRWFHPLAPPAYGPYVMASLRDQIWAGDVELIEAHSQGSVISVLTLSQASDVDGISLLTYGSPLGLLYKPLFPATGIEPMIAGLGERLGGRWVNLWRPTDPLGGEPIGLDDRDLEVTDSMGHTGYELSSTFREARHRLVG
jgi:hypothetical protein